MSRIDQESIQRDVNFYIIAQPWGKKGKIWMMLYKGLRIGTPDRYISTIPVYNCKEMRK
jgi:hypothetical protein